jgi:hypothetical protein
MRLRLVIDAAVHLPLWIEYRFWLPLLPMLLVTAAMAGCQPVSGHLKTYFFDQLPEPVLLGWACGW